MARPVERWLETFMCGQYADTFQAHGYRTLQSVCQLDPHHLRVMGVLPEHCEKIMENVSVLRQSYMAKGQGAPSTPIDPVVNPASSALATVARNANTRGGMPGYDSPGPGGGYMNSGQMAPVNFPHQQNAQMGMPPSMQQYPGGPGYYGSGQGQGQSHGAMYMQQQQQQQYGRPGNPYMNQMGPGGMQMPQGYAPPGYGPGGMSQSSYQNAAYGPNTSQHAAMGGMASAGAPPGNAMYSGTHSANPGHTTSTASNVGGPSPMGGQSGCMPGPGQQGLPGQQQNMPPQQNMRGQSNMANQPNMSNPQSMSNQPNMPNPSNMPNQPNMSSQQPIPGQQSMADQQQGMVGGGGGGGQAGMSAGPGMGGSMIHHHTRNQLMSQSPQQVADNILQMASHQYTANGLPLPHGNKYGPVPPGPMGPNQMGPGQMGPGHMGPGQMGPGQMGPGQMSPSPHMMQNSPNQYSGMRPQGNSQFMYPNASPMHPQSRMSPVSPMQVRSPASVHSNPPSMPSTSPGPMHSPVPMPERSPANASIPSPSMTTMRSPSGSMQAMHSPMNCNQPMRSPMHNLGPTPSPHMSVSSQPSPVSLGGMPMRSPSHPGPQGPGPGPGCGPGPGPGPGPGNLGGPGQGPGHFSPNPNHPAMNCSSGHSSPSGYSSCSQPPGPPPQATTNTSMYLDHSTSAPTYSNPSISDSSAHQAANPLQSLQKLVMLPESQVVDPKSVVNDACLPSTDGSKNCDGPKNFEGCESIDKAEPVSSQPRCSDGKHCGSDIEAQEDGVPGAGHEDDRTTVKAQTDQSADAVTCDDGTSPPARQLKKVSNSPPKSKKESKKEKKSKNSKKGKFTGESETRLNENGECDGNSAVEHEEEAVQDAHDGPSVSPVSPRRGRQKSGPHNGPVTTQTPVKEDPHKDQDFTSPGQTKIGLSKKKKSRKQDQTAEDGKSMPDDAVVSPSRKRRSSLVENGPTSPKKVKPFKSSPDKLGIDKVGSSVESPPLKIEVHSGSGTKKGTSVQVEILLESLSPKKGLQGSISPRRGKTNGVDPVVDLGKRTVSPGRSKVLVQSCENDLEKKGSASTEDQSISGDKVVSPVERRSQRNLLNSKHEQETSGRRTRKSSRDPKDADADVSSVKSPRSRTPPRSRIPGDGGDNLGSVAGGKPESPELWSTLAEKDCEGKIKSSGVDTETQEKVKDIFREHFNDKNFDASGNSSTTEVPKVSNTSAISAKPLAQHGIASSVKPVPDFECLKAIGDKVLAEPKENKVKRELRVSPRIEKLLEQNNPTGKPKRRRRSRVRPSFIEYDSDSSTDEDYVLPARRGKMQGDGGSQKMQKNVGKIKGQWQPEEQSEEEWMGTSPTPKFGKRKLGLELETPATRVEENSIHASMAEASLVGQQVEDMESEDTLPSQGDLLFPLNASLGEIRVLEHRPTTPTSEPIPVGKSEATGLANHESSESLTTNMVPAKLEFPDLPEVPSAGLGESLADTPDKKKRGRPHGSKNKGRRPKSKHRDDEPVSDTELQVLKLKKTLDLVQSGKKKPEKLNSGCLGPVVRVTGSKENPVSCVVVNARDTDHEKASKKKKPYSSDGRPDKASTVTSYNFLESVPWLCAFCGNGSNYKMLGDLFGPYYPEIPAPGSPVKLRSPCAPSAEPEQSLSSQPESLGRRRKKKRSGQTYEESTDARELSQRRSSTSSKDNVKTSASSIEELPGEIWVHEDCVVWSHGVYLLGNKLHGLEEAINVAKQTVCSACRLPGATLGCFLKGCSLSYHYLCAVEKDCHLDENNFSLVCPKHKDKKVKMLNISSSLT